MALVIIVIILIKKQKNTQSTNNCHVPPHSHGSRRSCGFTGGRKRPTDTSSDQTVTCKCCADAVCNMYRYALSCSCLRAICACQPDTIPVSCTSRSCPTLRPVSLRPSKGQPSASVKDLKSHTARLSKFMFKLNRAGLRQKDVSSTFKALAHLPRRAKLPLPTHPLGYYWGILGLY